MNTALATTISADPTVPAIRITREFDAPPAAVFRAHVDPDLVVRWLGPRRLTMTIQRWAPQTGGGYRYTHVGEDRTEHHFFGSFHEVREGERLVQTFTYEGVPDMVALETMTFVELPGGRTRLEGFSIGPSFEARDAMLQSGMEEGVVEGYERLDEVLAR
ncbi:SRPBCC family protein [Actinomycetospora sp. TBRC 11914]|uniref:SRPBCC family protein n=1 Tax=Actinomycetospora sp. TBRC 11914 TaxID=2729387 RepID=UPI00145E13A2|nr:SRPBCC family protein [Actinomycetospora sp. TBRC 11914]NMO91380.1 SRPBCC family protein [Actinomycetospora sp. TBRC 11914]